jgi:hypothetical protein
VYEWKGWALPPLHGVCGGSPGDDASDDDDDDTHHGDDNDRHQDHPVWYTTFPLGFTRKGMFWGLYTIPRLQDDDVIETWAGRLL